MHSKVDKDPFVKGLKERFDTKQEDERYLGEPEKKKLVDLLSSHNNILEGAPERLSMVNEIGKSHKKPTVRGEVDNSRTQYENRMEG